MKISKKEIYVNKVVMERGVKWLWMSREYGGFPIYKKQINGKPIIYMDSACVTLRANQVINAVARYYKEFPACAGRSTHCLGKIVSEEIHDSRKIMQKFLGAKRTSEIIFTKNSTEGINLIAKKLKIPLVTQDKHFSQVSDLITVRTPEEL